jgi:cation:H+ antiporter
MIWLHFGLSALVVVLAAVRLAKYGDIIALRTRLGGLFIGTVLLATATSLPELLTALNSIQQGAPSLSAGDFFGSSMFNMLMLAILDLLHQQKRILRQVAMQHALTAGLATLLMGFAIFAILADLDLRIGWVGIDSLILIGLYLYGMRLINRNSRQPDSAEERAEELLPELPSLRFAVTGFLVATLVLVLVTPWLVRSSIEIAELTGLGVGFVGAALVAIVTSLPEVVTTIAAARMGSFHLAVGNLFGSNAFNIFALGIVDFFYLPGRFLAAIDPALVLAGLTGLLLTSMALIGNLAREERRLLFIEVDALLILIGYIGGMWVLYSRGIVS